MKFRIENKWIDAEQSSFKEIKDPQNGKIKYYLEALIVPFGKVSRNGVKYKKEKVVETHPMLVGKNLMHNHVLEGANTLPRGEWVATWIGVEGMHARAEVYNVDYNKDYIEYLKSATSPRVSLQVTGDAEQKKNKEGKYYQEAEINDWLEASTVNVPGFDDAKASFAVAMSEAFGLKPEKNSFGEKLKFKVGTRVVSTENPRIKGVISKDPHQRGQVIVKWDGKGEQEYWVDEKLLKKESLSEDNTMDNSGDLLSTKLPKDKDRKKELAPGKYKTKGGEEITVHSISGNKAVISGNDSKNKEIDLDALKAIIGKEGFFEQLAVVREESFFDGLDAARKVKI